MASANVLRAILPYAEPLTADTITVTIDSNTYILERTGDGDYGAGSSPTSNHPVGIDYFGLDINYIYLDETSFSVGNHHITIQGDTSAVEVSECFKKAVRSISGGIILTLEDIGGVYSIEGAAWQEAYNMLANGAMMYLNNEGTIIPCEFFGSGDITFGQTVVGDVVRHESWTWSSDGSVSAFQYNYPANAS